MIQFSRTFYMLCRLSIFYHSYCIYSLQQIRKRYLREYKVMLTELTENIIPINIKIDNHAKRGSS